MYWCVQPDCCHTTCLPPSLLSAVHDRILACYCLPVTQLWQRKVAGGSYPLFEGPSPHRPRCLPPFREGGQQLEELKWIALPILSFPGQRGILQGHTNGSQARVSRFPVFR